MCSALTDVAVEKIESVLVGQVGGVIAEVPVPKYGRGDLPSKNVPVTILDYLSEFGKVEPQMLPELVAGSRLNCAV